MRNLLLALINISLFISCNEECIDLSDYEFELPFSLSPQKDTFQIGDTIRIYSSFQDLVFERNTKRHFKLENFRFFPEMRMREISDTTPNEAAINDFEVLVDSNYNFKPFYYSTGEVSYVGDFTYKNNNYELIYKIIPHKSGLYYHSLFTLLFEFGKNQNFEGRCPKNKAGLDAFVKLNEGVDNNIHMLSYSPDPHFNTWLLINHTDRFHKFAGYCFYVKE